MVGIAIGNAIVAAMAVTAGTVGPMLVYAPEKVFTPRALVLLVAIALIVAGIYLYGKAALRKEREVAGLAEGVPQASSNFRRGLIICLFTGILGTAFIYSLVSSHGLLQAAQAAGAKPLFAGYVAWVVTFNAGFLPNLLYSLYLLRKNRSTRAFGQSEVLARNSSLGALMGLIWFSGVLMYGMGVTQMGRLGPSVGYGLFVSSTVLSANFLGWLSGEWKGASPATVRGFMKGMVLIVIAVFVIAVGVS
jgi:L-rhamnose-H+ transport protein